MAKLAVRVEKQANQLSFHLSGPGLANANSDLLNECMNKLMTCAEENDCFTKGLSAACIAAIAGHDKQSQCLSKAFGFARG
jgi:hypothetical protein